MPANVLENVNQDALNNKSEEELRAMLLQAQEQLSAAKASRGGDKPVEVLMGEYTPPKSDKAVPTVRILNDGRPFAMGVKGVRRILDNGEAIQTLQSKAAEDAAVGHAIEAIGGNFYKANKVLTHRAEVEALMEKHGY